MSEPISIYRRLRQVQQELKVPKTESGRFGKHRNVEGILEAAKPVLDKHDLTVVMSSRIIELNGRSYVQAEATIYDDQGEKVTVAASAWEGDISRGLDAPQVTGAATSYARKYALGGLLALDDSKDPDSHTDEAPRASSSVQRPQSIARMGVAIAGSALATKAQIQLMLTAAKRASGLEDRGDVIDFFTEEIGKSPDKVLSTEVGTIIKRFNGAGSDSGEVKV